MKGLSTSMNTLSRLSVLGQDSNPITSECDPNPLLLCKYANCFVPYDFQVTVHNRVLISHSIQYAVGKILKKQFLFHERNMLKKTDHKRRTVPLKAYRTVVCNYLIIGTNAYKPLPMNA